MSEEIFNTKENKREHILACLSSSPSNARIIRTAAKMAEAFDCKFTVLFVETPAFKNLTDENKKRISDNQKLARSLGAGVETVYGDDVAYQIAEFARLFNVTKIVLGRSAFENRGFIRRHLVGRPPLSEQLLSYVPQIDIHIIPDTYPEPLFPSGRLREHSALQIVLNTLRSLLILIGATILSLIFHNLGFTDSNIIMVYILGVLLTSIVTSHQAYSLISSIASVFIFNYLFTVPRFSLAAYGTGYPVTFVVMFLTAYITGTFAIRYKEQAARSEKTAYRTKILFDTDQMLSKLQNKDEILNGTANQIRKLLNRDIVIFDTQDGTLSEPKVFPVDEKEAFEYNVDKEMDIARWALKNNHSAGATTGIMSDSDFLYLALRVNERVYGVIGINVGDDPLDASENGMLLSILGECALALENEKNAREKEAAAILAESEQLRANILRTISHDLRTPLTTISGNASNLMSNSDGIDEATKKQLYTDIYDDSIWLTSLVENLLHATRIEEGRMTLSTSDELLSDIIYEAVNHIRIDQNSHTINVNMEDDMVLVKVDVRLIMQVISNIIDNAIKYTPKGSKISVSTGTEGSMAFVEIADNGPGISDEAKEKIFDKFYCGDNKIADNRRSLGLGLYLCKAFVDAHNGTISISDNKPSGAVFRFTLPLAEVNYNE